MPIGRQGPSAADTKAFKDVRSNVDAEMIGDAAGEAAAAAKSRIFQDSHLRGERVWCEFDRGTLYLRGRVSSFFLKQLAQQAVLGLRMVRQVVNEIDVVG